VIWKYIGTSTTSGSIAKVHDGTRELLRITYGANGRPSQIQNANDLDSTNRSPGYDSSHKVTISYDTQTVPRVTSVAEGPITGQSPSTSTWTFAYFAGSVSTSATGNAHGDLPAGSTRTADGYTEITPPRQQGTGKKTVVYYDDLDHPIDTLDLLNHHSRAAYTRSDQLVWTEDQDGNPTDYDYDPVTNLLRTKTDPDPDGGGSQTRPVTSYRYDEATIGTSTSAGTALRGLHASYFPNENLSGRPTADLTDPLVDFNWGTGGPSVLGARTDNYSIRWSGLLTIPAGGEGDYTFTTISDGNTTLAIGQTTAVDGDDQQTVLADDHDHTVSSASTKPIHLEPGPHTLTLEYTETTGSAEIHLRYSCTTCSPQLADQVVPTALLSPNWQNQTSTVSPAGRLSFSHYANPVSTLPDYTEQKLADGTPVITTFTYDDYGRLTRKVSPRGNAGLTADGLGNLNGTGDLTYATTWAYYGLTETAAPPAHCSGGSATAEGGLLKSMTPSATGATQYVYDSAGREIAKTDAAGTTCTAWTSEGRKSSTTDANGHTTAYTYDPAGQVRTVTAADSTVTTTVYDESGAVKSKTDGNNHTTTYAHDAEGNRTSVTDPLSHTTTNAYDELGRKTSTTDPLNHTTSFTYDNLGRLTATTTPLGKVSATTYVALGRVTAKTDANNHATTFGYDADGNQTSVTDPLGHTSTTSYDALGRVASKTDANNHTTTFAYDADGNQVSVTDPLSHTTSYGYDAAGRKATATDPLSHTTFYAYDSAGRQVSTTNPEGETTQTAYDAVGNVVSTTDAAGKTTSFTYDAVNRQTSMTSPLAETTSYGYDSVGNKTSLTDPLGKITSYAFDAADRPTTTTVDTGSGHLNLATTLAYDNAGRLTSTTDPNSHTTSYGYDNDGRRTSVTGPDSSSTTLTYDNVGNVLTRTDDNNHTTTFTYDAADRLTSKTDPLSRVWTYQYDAVGNKTQVTDANGNATTGVSTDGITTYSYDAADRLTGIDYSDNTPDISYGYDNANRKTSITDGAGTQSYGYDDADRVTSITRSSSSFSYTYDSAGRLSTRTYPDGTATGYAYDNDSRISTVTVGSNTTGYTYDNNSRVTATAYPNGWTEQRTYDAAGRLSDIRSVKTGSANLAVATYTRDGAGNPTTIVRDGVTETYTYDNADRVTAACYGGAVSTCASGSKITYTYDKVGNRLTQTKFGTTTNYHYDGADELCWSGASTGANCTTPNGNTAYSYDNDGQQTGEGTKTFSYDLAGHLLQVADGTTTLATYTYDGNDNRLTKAGNSVTTAYRWDENNDLPMLATESQGGSTLRSYVRGDTLLSMNTGGSAYYFHHDALDTTSAITKSSGATEWTYTYDPYGMSRSSTKVDSQAPDNPTQYTGELVDSETGLYNLRARAYAPADGRFLGVDPLAQDRDRPALSSYLYANANPMVFTDPSGERICIDDDCRVWAPPAPTPTSSAPPAPPQGTDNNSGGSGNAAGGGDRSGSHPADCGSACSNDGPPPEPEDDGTRRTQGSESSDGSNWCSSASKEQCHEAENVLSECETDTQAKRELCIWKFLRALGLTQIQTAAVLGNIWWESDKRVDPSATEQKPGCVGKPAFTPGCGVGLLQWTDQQDPGREQGLLDFAGGSLGSALDIRTQLRYMWKELSNPSSLNYPLRDNGTLGKLRATYPAGSTQRAVRVAMNRATALFMNGDLSPELGSLNAREAKACRYYEHFTGKTCK